MALNSTHPNYRICIDDWSLMRDAYAGERVVKNKGTVYLPVTPGQLLDGARPESPLTTDGWINYSAYKERAQFPDYVSDAVEAYLGMLHQKPPTIELPARMEPLRTNATNNGESLELLLRRVNEQQLAIGRLGLFLDLPTSDNVDPAANTLPYISVYAAENIRNWDDSNDGTDTNKLNLVVLDESNEERQEDFEWKRVEKYRVLMLASEARPAQQEEPGIAPSVPVQEGDYIQGLFRMEDGHSTLAINSQLMFAPVLRGVKLQEIPFVMVNSKDLVATPDNPPLLGLGRLCMSIYRGEADYRHTLFMQGQDTLVVIGGLIQTQVNPDGSEAAVRVGAGSRLEVNMNGDAKYIGVGAEGLAEQRSALENDRKRAETKAGTLISPAAGKQESGDALSTRLSAQTATLNQVANTGAAALEHILRIAARWMGEDPEKVKVTPNREFVTQKLEGAEVVQFMTARNLGAPLSLESIHGIFVNRGLTKLTFDEEMEKIGEEDVAMMPKTPPPQAPVPPPGSPAPAPASA